MTNSSQTAFLIESSRLLQKIKIALNTDAEGNLLTVGESHWSKRILKRIRFRLVGEVDVSLENSFLLLTEVLLSS
jgi:hypothetical protein